MVAILKDMGINDFEPRVINQMLEFSYRWSFSFHILAYSRTPRYVTGILEDARVYSNHARKKTLDTEDVKLAVQLAAEQVLFENPFLENDFSCSKGFTSPPPREALLELARAKNATQLPLIQVPGSPRYDLLF